MRAEALLDELKVPDAVSRETDSHDLVLGSPLLPPPFISYEFQQEREAWLEKYTLSPGQFTLEWVLPSPPPVHGFSEPPAVKEVPEDSHH
jgi:hypothetical protein